MTLSGDNIPKIENEIKRILSRLLKTQNR